MRAYRYVSLHADGFSCLPSMANATPIPPPSSRQKRVLPSRSRRGGPGIGTCDVDLMILDAQKRRRS